MKQNLQNAQKLVDANLTRIQKLNLKIYHQYVTLIRLYAYASGKKVLKNNSKKRNADDERRLLWTVQHLKENIEKIEQEIKSFIEKYC